MGYNIIERVERMRGLQQEEGSQYTIKKEVKYTGTALHSGEEVSIRLLPARADRGIVFRRVDLPGNPEIEANPCQVVSTTRCTSLGLEQKGEAVIHTVEHMMAAFWSYNIDNIIVEIDNAETPVTDGSAYPFLQLLEKAGRKKLSYPRNLLKIEDTIFVRNGRRYMILLPYDGFRVSYTLDYDHSVIGTQFREFDIETDSFSEEIARARTFGFQREVEALHRRGLALGGSLENAVLIGENETVNPLRYPDEFVRHKILDVIGDMALNGQMRGHVIAVCSGHSLHVELAQKVRKKIIKQECEVSD